MDRPVQGWKVARVGDDQAIRWGVRRIAGPVFDIWEADGGQTNIPLIEGGYAAAEAEYGLLIRRVPPGAARSSDEAAEAIGAARIAIEVAGSPYAEINAHGPAVTVSDFGNNIGLVLGPAVPAPDFGRAFNWPVSSYRNGERVGTGVAANPAGGPIEAARFLFELAAEHDLPIAAGQWISAGAITGGHPVKAGDNFEARFGDQEIVSTAFER